MKILYRFYLLTTYVKKFTRNKDPKVKGKQIMMQIIGEQQQVLNEIKKDEQDQSFCKINCIIGDGQFLYI